MTRRLVIQAQAQAQADITDAAIWYQKQQDGLGTQFLDEIETAMGRVVEDPHQFPRLRRKPEVRRVMAGRFPYPVFFVAEVERVIVFRVLQGARHDREWKRDVPAV